MTAANAPEITTFNLDATLLTDMLHNGHVVSIGAGGGVFSGPAEIADALAAGKGESARYGQADAAALVADAADWADAVRRLGALLRPGA